MTNTRWLCGAALAALTCAVPAFAQESGDSCGGGSCPVPIPPEGEILVTATRSPIGTDAGLAPVTAFTIAPEIARNRQYRDLGDALRDIPSVAVSAVAGQTQIRLRGSEANHVLVLVDGIEVSDPFAGEFDIGTLQSEIGARAEVVLGPQSALYGSDAIGGVVSYYSAGGCGGSPELYFEGGSDNTLNASARAGLCDEWGSLGLGVTRVSTDGEPNARAGERDIGRDSSTLSAKLELHPGDSLTLRAVGRYVFTEGEFNDQDFDPASPTFGLVIDSPGTRFENEALYALVGAGHVALGGRWTNDLSFQLADIARDSFGPFGRTFGSEGNRLKGSYVSSILFDTETLEHRLTLAADWEEERYRNTDPFGFAFTGTRTNENVGLVGEYQLEGRDFLVSGAVRRDINDNFADATTFRVAGSVRVTGSTRLRAAVGTGIKNPGFYELFGFVDGRFIGNEALRPEKSTGWEAGIDQQLLDGAVKLSLVYFESDLEGEIFTNFPAPDFVATPANRTSESRRRGVELSADAELFEGLWLTARYTRLDAEEDGATEVRRPEDVASASLDWSNRADSLRASLVVRHSGAAEDLAFTDPSFVPVRVRLGDYTLVNLYAEADISEGLSLFGRVENLLDDRYEQVFSFVSPGLTATAGFRAKF